MNDVMVRGKTMAIVPTTWTRLFFIAVLVLVSFIVGACSDDGSNGATTEPRPEPEPMPEVGVTWHGEIRDIVERNCVSCHSQGGIGPFVLDNYDDAFPMASASLAAIEDGTMPPWLPDPECRTFPNQRILTSAEKAAFRQWVDAGAPEGAADEEQDRREDTQGLTTAFEPTHSGKSVEQYTPDLDNPDDYRCFILDLEFDERMFLEASQVVPDQTAIVHHVLVYVFEEEQVADIVAADQNDEGPGYRCFGTPFPSSSESNILETGAGLPTQIGAWVPGVEPAVYEDGYAIPINPGSRIVMQVHYNTLTTDPVPDQTEFHMTLTTDVPQYELITRPLPILQLDIPAGEDEAVEEAVFTNYRSEPIQIVSMAPHMHLLGSRVDAHIVRDNANSTDAECLIEIPRWDFDWQQFYPIAEEDPVILNPGDSINLKCTYDNSAANQPVVNGQQIEPRDVGWGEGTLDEMCLLYVTMVQPYEPTAETGAMCGGADDCVSACENPRSIDCLLGCEDIDLGCGICAISEVVDCSLSTCAGPLVGSQSCITECFINKFVFDGPLTRCMEDRCADSLDAISTCIDPVLDGGSCDQGLRGCNIELPE